MKIAIDLDGVITGNPSVYSYLTYHLTKNENDFEVFIVTWRDGSDEVRKEETIEDLRGFNIRYDQLIMAPKKFRIMRIAGYWKVTKIKELGINIWIDDEIKAYKRDFNLDVKKLLPEVTVICI